MDRYEFLVYRLLRDNLEAGDVFCRDSVHSRSFEDDLLSDVQWQQKEALIARTGLPILNQKVEAHLSDLKDALETQLEQVNQRITAGENEHINICNVQQALNCQTTIRKLSRRPGLKKRGGVLVEEMA